MEAETKRIVVKVGTSTLIHETGRTNIRHMKELAAVLSDLKNTGHEVVLVTSGAIGVGVGKLRLPARPKDTPGRQAAATVGQCELMFMYDKFFSEYGHTVGQLLITKSDVDDDERRGNLINAFEKLLEYGVIPIINENDSVGVEEIVFGDNDSLSAIVARLIRADMLIILTDTDGLFDKDPSKHSDAKLIPEVDEITDGIASLAGGAGTDMGTGGMVTKIQAARIATEAGIDTFVINGTPMDNLYQVIEGDWPGTRFRARKTQQ